MTTKRNEVLAALFPDVDTTQIEGEFIPEVEEPEPAYEYKGEFRFVNVPPTRLKLMLERNDLTDSDRDAVQTALHAWGRIQGGRGGIEAGEPYRGEPRQAQVFNTIREMVAAAKPVGFVTEPSLSSPQGRIMAERQWLGIFDFDALEAGLKELE